jgi:hypothetical protein
MSGQIINRGIVKIPNSKITAENIRQITKTLINNSWQLMLSEVSYASDAINMIESREIYRDAKLQLEPNDPSIKPDHTAARGFIDSNLENKLENIDVANISYQQLTEIFTPLTGTAFSTLIMQILGANISNEIYNFDKMHAEGTYLGFLDTTDIILDKTKYFVSNQDISLLKPNIQTAIREDIADYQLKISEEEWQILQRIYLGEHLSDAEITLICNDLEKKIFACHWKISENNANLLKKAAAKGEKPNEYAYSTLLRGTRLNHGTWRVADIFRGFGVLQLLHTNPVPIRGFRTMLEQTAGMASECDYLTKEDTTFKGPGAFLELASRPYMLLDIETDPIDAEGNKIDLNSELQPILFREINIQLDSRKWENSKKFLDHNGREVSLADINSGKYIQHSKLIDFNGQAKCYEAFKETNAEGIFFASGGKI